MRILLILVILLAVIIGGLFIWNTISEKDEPKSGEVLDEAMAHGRTADTFPGADEDYFADMDYGITKQPEELASRLSYWVEGITPEAAVAAAARGRNNWIVWTAGNDRFWDEISNLSFGNLDLIKTLSNYPSLKYSRDNRWQYLGLVNEPCFEKAKGPREDRHGLWLDVRSDDCPPDPFENSEKYPGVEFGARGKNIETGSFYGYATGIVGLRLFPNPAFDEAAEAAWDPVRYYDDPNYFKNKDLVKPYRVGMSCGFCHVGPNPSNPPTDPENPTWAQLNSNPGAQYFWIDRIFSWEADYSNFVFQLFHTSQPGALDTSLVSSDQINNPRTMNAVYNLPARLEISQKWGKEKLSGGEKNNKQFADYAAAVGENSPLLDTFEAPDTVFTPRVLKDGADSVGALGALNRVFVNIGLFSEEWMLHFVPLVGGADITPFPIAAAQKNSSYWQATENQTPDLGLFFLGSAEPDYLANAPGGASYLTEDEEILTRGKTVFAETCARCHSSKLPEKAFTDHFPDQGCVNDQYLHCWNDYWQWTKTDEFKTAMTEIVLQEDFLENNFLGTELRVPVTLLETNACSPLATNAIEGDIWNDFSSSSYKGLPAVGTIQVQDPFTEEVDDYVMPAGGRGYTRPASLVSLWSTAPYLLNNSVGEFEWTGSVDARVKSFEDGIQKMLNPELRGTGDGYTESGKKTISVVTRSGKTHPGTVHVTTEASYLRVASGFLPDFLQPLTGFLSNLLPNVFTSDGIQLGPIPSGTPVNLLSNIDLQEKKKVLELALKIKKDLKALPANATDEQAMEVFKNLKQPLLDVSKCPDFVVNKGHYFGTEFLPESEGETPLSAEDKAALIEFLKTL